MVSFFFLPSCRYFESRPNWLFSYLLSKHWQDFQGNVTSTGDPRYGGRGHRLLPWPGAVWTLSAPRGATLGWGCRTQRRGALWTIPGETQTVCCTWVGQLVEGLDERVEREEEKKEMVFRRGWMTEKGYIFFFFCEAMQVEVFVCSVLKFRWKSSLITEHLSLFARAFLLRPLHMLQLWTYKYPSFCFLFFFFIMLKIAHPESAWMKEVVDNCTGNILCVRAIYESVCVSMGSVTFLLPFEMVHGS